MSPISSIDSNVTQERSSIIKIAHTRGELELTPDHVLLVDGEWAASRTVKVCVAASLHAPLDARYFASRTPSLFTALALTHLHVARLVHLFRGPSSLKSPTASLASSTR